MKKHIWFLTAPFVLLALMAPGLSPASATGLLAARETAPFLEHVANVRFKAYDWGTLDIATFDVPALDAAGRPTGEVEQRDFAFVLDTTSVLKSIDVTDPGRPVVVSEQCIVPSGHGTVDVRADLGLLVSTARPCGRAPGSIGVFDVSSPRAVKPLAAVRVSAIHTVSVHPTQPYAYVAGANRFGVEIIDLSAPEKPKLAEEAPTLSSLPHDVQFDGRGIRAFVGTAGGTEIWDVRSGAAPRLFETVVDPSTTTHSWARPSPDDGMLVVQGNPGVANHCMALHFYTSMWYQGSLPVKTGVYAPAAQSSGGDCGPFFHDVHPNPRVDLVASAWGSLGTRILRLKGTTPESYEVAVSNPGLGSDAQYATFFKGHIYTVDEARGMDVFRLPPG